MKNKKSELVEMLNFMFSFVALIMGIMLLCMVSLDYLKVEPKAKQEVQIIEDAQKVTSIHVNKVVTGKWAGTGFSVKYGSTVVTVTNAHVCMADEDNVLSIKGKVIKVGQVYETIISVDEENDLCLITSSINKHLGLSLVPSDYKSEDLDEVYTVGFPHTKEKNILTGRILSVENGILNIKVVGGQSGSPVLNKHNQVVGVIWGRQTNEDSHGLYISVEELRSFLKYELYGLGRDQ